MYCDLANLSVILFFLLENEAKISIDITVKPREVDVRIIYSGDDVKLITQKEINLFNLTNEKINKGFRIELGKIPNDIYFKDPTPYHDLFKKYKWPEVKRMLKIKKAKLIGINNQDVIVKSHEYINNTTGPIKITTIIHENLENSINLIWLEDGLPEDEIDCNLNVDFNYGILSYENKWKNNGFKNMYLPFNISKNGSMTIESGQTVISKFTAYKSTMLIEIVYEARLVGNVIGNYAELYGKYHFWSPSINKIMNAGKIKNEILTVQYIEIRCYTNPKLTVFDKSTNKTIEPIKKMKPLMKIYKKKNTKHILYRKRTKI